MDLNLLPLGCYTCILWLGYPLLPQVMILFDFSPTSVKTKPYYYPDIYPDICTVNYPFCAYLVYVMCLHFIGCTVDQPSIRMHHSRPFLRDCQNVLQYQWDRSKPLQPVWDRVFVIYFILCCEELFRFHYDVSCKTVVFVVLFSGWWCT